MFINTTINKSVYTILYCAMLADLLSVNIKLNIEILSVFNNIKIDSTVNKESCPLSLNIAVKLFICLTQNRFIHLHL